MTAWGAGDYRSLSDGEGSAVDWDGHLFGAHLGMDARFGAGGLAGLALSVSKGRFDYTDTSAEALGKTVKGEYESRMTSAHPYVGWGMAGGEARLGVARLRSGRRHPHRRRGGPAHERQHVAQRGGGRGACGVLSARGRGSSAR